MKNLIIETDCGHDPDDFFAICYLIAIGYNVKSIVVTPGDLDQLAITRLISETLGLNVPIGSSKVSDKLSSGNFHYAMLDHYGYRHDGYSDGAGDEIIAKTFTDDCEFFVIGPPTNVGRYLKAGGKPPKALTMQGGFAGYHLYEPSIKDPKFNGLVQVPTFNMNGDRKGTIEILNANIPERRFCGKNVCHTIFLDSGKHFTPKNKASELFCLGMKELLSRKAEKKFHDPVAAVSHAHPEIGTWLKGKTTKMESGWGTVPSENGEGDDILVDLDRTAFWNRLGEFS